MLKIQFRDGRHEPVLLTEPGKTIGRGEINDIVVDEEGVNSFHADLKVEGQSVILSDVKTKTGTYLNGEKINGPTRIQAGDLIRIMQVELDVIDASAAAADGKTLVLSGSALSAMGIGGWSIRATSGPDKGQVVGIKDKISIGRSLENDLAILEPGLSRRHAEIEIVDGKLVVRDLDSANGTFINDERIKEAKPVPGDTLKFEHVSFLVNGP